MVRKLHAVMGAALALAAAAPASASDLTLSENVRVTPTMTYTTAAGVAANKTNGSYTGVGSLFVEFASTATTGFGALCTGSLVSNKVVVTAAHCLSDTDEDGNYDPVTAVYYFLPSYGEATTVLTVKNWAVNPNYTGDVTEGNDVAMFTLSNQTSGHDVYSIYQGDPMGLFTRVGTGTVGGPRGTGTGGVTDDYDQRVGKNLYEYYGDLVTGWSENILLSDFDDGTTNHDAFGRLLGVAARQAGVTGESNSSPGDSGGPIFINGQLVAVTSFGITGDAFRSNGYCGGFAGQNSIDPYGAGGTTGINANIQGCTNSSVGEISGDTWLKPYQGFINQYLAASVPEPQTWAMMILGFGMVGGVLRTRRREGKLATA